MSLYLNKTVIKKNLKNILTKNGNLEVNCQQTPILSHVLLDPDWASLKKSDISG